MLTYAPRLNFLNEIFPLLEEHQLMNESDRDDFMVLLGDLEESDKIWSHIIELYAFVKKSSKNSGA